MNQDVIKTLQDQINALAMRISELEQEKKIISAGIIRARKFELIDASGKIRAEIGMDNNVQFVLKDEDGKRRLMLTLDKNGSNIFLVDPTEKARVGLGLSKDKAAFTLHDSIGTILAGITVDNTGSRLALLDAGKLEIRSALIIEPGKMQMLTGDGKIIWETPKAENENGE